MLCVLSFLNEEPRQIDLEFCPKVKDWVLLRSGIVD